MAVCSGVWGGVTPSGNTGKRPLRLDTGEGAGTFGRERGYTLPLIFDTGRSGALPMAKWAKVDSANHAGEASGGYRPACTPRGGRVSALRPCRPDVASQENVAHPVRYCIKLHVAEE